ncbi:MAG: hypothetical protein KY439_00745 [Actinobacteria bacterium]|nr:hypothetical protein [Actinomycetota bacterium]
MTETVVRSRAAERAFRAVVAGLLLVTMAACGSGSEEAEPQPDDLETVRGEGFSVLLPKGAERQEQPVPGGDLKVILYGVERGDAFYALSYTELPEGTPISTDGAVEGSASNIGGTAVDKVPLTYKGFEAIDARITGAKNNGVEGTAFTRVVSTPGRLYQVLTVVKGKDAAVSETHKRIRESLEFG